MKALLFDEIIVKILLGSKIDADFICLPFLPFLHPFWFFKKNILMSFESGKIPLTPFLFDYKSKDNLNDFYDGLTDGASQKSIGSNPSFLDVTPKYYEAYCKKIINRINASSNNNEKPDMQHNATTIQNTQFTTFHLELRYERLLPRAGI